jgi:hypothetical protein
MKTFRPSSGYGDGMAYELAPLTAVPMSEQQLGYGSLALQNGACAHCAARMNGTERLFVRLGLQREDKSLTPLGYAATAAAVVGTIYYLRGYIERNVSRY